MLSKFPVGSSANIILGSFIIALHIAVLCFSPPDTSVGYLYKIFSISNLFAFSNINDSISLYGLLLKYSLLKSDYLPDKILETQIPLFFV